MNSIFRRALAVSVAGVCLAAVGTFAVPAAVAAIHQAELDATAQSFELASSSTAIAATPETERDAFEITEYTLVQWPLPEGTTISSFFGYRSCEGCSTMHSGIDIVPGGAGIPIEAIADGVVVGSSVADGSWGVNVTIQHDVDGVTYRSAYAHMQAGSMTLSPGDTVQRGQVIGRVGNTGQSFGAHLHFVIQTADGTFIDPLPWLRENANIDD
ncbi:MAG: M23 family metallopeptidase [Pseudolysinimonas sp.]|uniref:M23 family metallopeptidase n=1 Tax=Pseudolysinimonas sp. TaxID=2680009 RepID=UPI003C752DB6